MTFLYDVLSVWELAHRWCDIDPNLSDPEKLPLEVQDRLRFLTRMMANHELHSCSVHGSENTIHLDVMRFEEYINAFYDNKGISEGEKWTHYEDYQDRMDRKMEKHNQNIEGLEQCYQSRKYNKNQLDDLYVVQHNFARFCKRQSIPLPSFWYPENWNIELGGVVDDENTPPDDVITHRLKSNLEDRISCRAIAQALWDTNPELTIEDIKNHRHIQVIGNGKQYKGRDTIRNWIKDLDPRPIDERIGRPSKKQETTEK